MSCVVLITNYGGGTRYLPETAFARTMYNAVRDPCLSVLDGGASGIFESPRAEGTDLLETLSVDCNLHSMPYCLRQQG